MFAGAGGAPAARGGPRDAPDCPRVALAVGRDGPSAENSGAEPVHKSRGEDGARADRDGADRDGADRDGRGRDRSGDREGRGGRRGYGGTFDMSWGYYGKSGHGDMRPPKPHEWLDVQLFMNRYSPRRQFALDQLPEGDKKESIRRFVFARYRSLQELQRRDKTGYDQRLVQLTLEDEIYGIVSAWGSASGEEQEQLRQSLHDKVAKLVDIDLRERQRRVDWLRRELEEQGRELERDVAEKDALVERRVSRFEDWAERSAASREKRDGQDERGGDRGKGKDRQKQDSPEGGSPGPSEKQSD